MQMRAIGMSCKEIQNLVYYIKKVCGLENELYFPILRFAENILPYLFDDDYTFCVVSKKELGDKHGETFPNEHIIRIREDVYLGAKNGVGRDRLTIAHEIGHLFLHDNDAVSFCRLEKGQKLRAFEDPEWQANCFGGELLASSYLIQNMTTEEIVKKCVVSFDAATIQLNRAKERMNKIF